MPFEQWDWRFAEETGKDRSTFDAGVLTVRVTADSLSLDGILRAELDSAVELESDVDWSRVEPWRMVPQRTMVIDGYVYTVTEGGIAIHSLSSLGRVTFQRF